MANWFRFYDDAVNDPKIIELPDDLFRAWVNVLCIAAKNDGVLPEMKHVALVLRVKPNKAAALVTRLVAAGLMDNHGGVFAPHNWQGRQFKSDDSGPRVKKHREKLRNAKSNGECNVTGGAESNGPEEKEKKTQGEESRRDAGAPIDEAFGRNLTALTTSVGLSFTTRGMPVPPLTRCTLWLQQGYARGTILGAIDRVLKRGRAISTLDYFDAAIAEDHAKAPAASNAEPEIDRSNWFIVVEGTLEHTCHNIIRKEQGQPPLFLCTQIGKDGTVYDRAAKCPTLFPAEFNDFGERISPSAEDAA